MESSVKNNGDVFQVFVPFNYKYISFVCERSLKALKIWGIFSAKSNKLNVQPIRSIY